MTYGESLPMLRATSFSIPILYTQDPAANRPMLRFMHKYLL
jgi:hypothetical protein